MVALVLYAFACAQRSSRVIERHCRQDVAYWVITDNLIPDHATIARFVCRHERALGELFGEVLGLCDRAGLLGRGWWRLTARASPATPARRSTASSTRSPGRSWPRPGRPTSPRTSATGRRAAMSCPSSCARRRADASSFARRGDSSGARTSTANFARSRRPRRRRPSRLALEFDAERIVARTQGREGWLREGRRQLERHRWRHPEPIGRSRRARLLLAAEREEADLDTERRANDAYEHNPGARVRPARSATGRPAGGVSTTRRALSSTLR
jgi:hypothetical protein